MFYHPQMTCYPPRAHSHTNASTQHSSYLPNVHSHPHPRKDSFETSETSETFETFETSHISSISTSSTSGKIGHFSDHLAHDSPRTPHAPPPPPTSLGSRRPEFGHPGNIPATFRQGDAHAPHTATWPRHRPKPHHKPTQPTSNAFITDLAAIPPAKNRQHSGHIPATFRQYHSPPAWHLSPQGPFPPREGGRGLGRQQFRPHLYQTHHKFARKPATR